MNGIYPFAAEVMPSCYNAAYPRLVVLFAFFCFGGSFTFCRCCARRLFTVFASAMAMGRNGTLPGFPLDALLAHRFELSFVVSSTQLFPVVTPRGCVRSARRALRHAIPAIFVVFDPQGDRLAAHPKFARNSGLRFFTVEDLLNTRRFVLLAQFRWNL